jgi:hypothetical protein
MSNGVKQNENEINNNCRYFTGGLITNYNSSQRSDNNVTSNGYGLRPNNILHNAQGARLVGRRPQPY